ncbi:type I polyketide synthase, partial [Nocardia sp. NPDC046473]|uniref:type I polyketide synthase n=1 Tax=Nocardia sp. NPDC046473 TaxID=3155733 RepID=UPI0033DF74A8
WVHGVVVDWSVACGGVSGRRVELPTYAFQRQRYWLSLTALTADVASAGLTETDHPMIGAAVVLADSGGAVFTGRLSLDSHPWLGDHAIAGTVLLPGTAFVELALWAGDQVDCDRVEELVLEVPLLLPADGDVQIQFEVGAAAGSGRRVFSLHGRPSGTVDGQWTRHATGVLAPQLTAPDVDLTVWPPNGATELDISDLHDRQRAAGFEFGPAFRGLRAAWLLDDQVFAEVRLPDEFADDARRFGLHPALLDAALHPLSFLPGWDSSGVGKLPLSWDGVSLHATGATTLRVRLTAIGSDTLALVACDSSGGLVAAAESFAMRAINTGSSIASAAFDSLYRMRWQAVQQPSRAIASLVMIGAEETIPGSAAFGDLAALAAAMDAGLTPPATVAVRFAAVGGDDVADRAHRASHSALALVQSWLSDTHFDASRLVVVTREAVAVTEAETHIDPAYAAVWGLLRSAQTENPGRIVLLDMESATDMHSVAAALAWTDESQIAMRAGAAYVPRLARMAQTESTKPNGYDKGTVLVTGASGLLGGLVARHLVSKHGSKRLVLASRSGRVGELVAELSGLGAEVVSVACDVADRKAVSGLLDAIPAEHPLTAVVHIAGVLDDGVVSSLNAGRIDTVMRPKVDAAFVLHELTRNLPLSEFVLFSSASGVLGGLGQANYAAANAFLDALALHRRGLGVPATSLAWGMWAQPSGMTGQLSQSDVERIERAGVHPMSADEGLALFDAAVAGDVAVVVPMRLDVARLRAGAMVAGQVPEIMRGLVRLPRRREAVSEVDSVGGRLSGLSASERDKALAEIVPVLVANALGYNVEEIDPHQTFQQLGIDSLTAIELRNGLNAAIGIRLPATLVFDYPTTAALIEHLQAELANNAPDVQPGTASSATERDTLAAQRALSITSLYFDACAAGRYVQANEMAVAAARLRPSFATADEVGVAREPVRLAAGEQSPVLVGFTSASPMSGPFEFTQIARHFDGARDLWVLPLPGFLAGERLPATWGALVEWLADRVEQVCAGRPAVLVGRSAGGTIAHSVAVCLEQRGAAVAGLVLLDTFEVGSEPALRIQSPMMRRIAADGARLGEMDDVGVTAMTGYFALFSDWQPVELSAPTLFVGATPDESTDWLTATWSLTHDLIRVSGSHYSMIDEGGEETAAAIDHWISGRS